VKKSLAQITKTIALLTVFALLVFLPVYVATAQGTTVKAQPSSNAPIVGSTFTVDITINNVQNLYGIDLSLNWNPTVLKVTSAVSFLGVESHPGGVLHGSINVEEEGASQAGGQYNLVAFSESPAAAFSGDGKIATLTFSVLKTGYSPFTLVSELADKPPAGGSSNFITHADVSSSVNAVIPEFPTSFAVVVLLVLAAGTLVFCKRYVKKNAISAGAVGARL
jgi:hypothetical protein